MTEKRFGVMPFGLATVLTAFLVLPFAASTTGGQTKPAPDVGVAVGAQYDSTHVYVAPGDLDAFVNSFVATFGGQPSKRSVTNVLPRAKQHRVPIFDRLRSAPYPSLRSKRRSRSRLDRNALDTWLPTWTRRSRPLVRPERK